MGKGSGWHMREGLGSLRVTMAMILPAPWLFSVSAALAKVPQVSAMSSIRMATLSLTSPTRTMEPTTFGLGLSLWISAKAQPRRSAIAVALGEGRAPGQRLVQKKREVRCLGFFYLLAPPASGLTMTASSLLRFSLIQRSTDGSA